MVSIGTMNSIAFITERLQATCSTQQNLSTATPPWVWSQKTVPSWAAEVTLLEQLRIAEITKRAEWRATAATWDGDLAIIARITRDVKREGSFAFRGDAVKRELFRALRTEARSRDDIYNQGEAARAAWALVDPLWTYEEEVTLGSFGSLLAVALTRKSTHQTALTAWRSAAAKLRNKALAVDADNVAWYAAATRQFRAGTEKGDLIRSTVPTTYRPPPPVGQAVIAPVMVAGGTIHFDCAAPHATRFAYLHQPPGAPGFAVLAADTAEASVTLANQPAGVHRFQAVGRNSGGDGPASVVVEVTVAAQQVA